MKSLLAYHLVATIALGNPTHWDYLHFDAPSHRLFISHGDHVDVLDTKTDKIIGSLAPLPGSHGITVDPATGYVWADSAANRLAIAFNPVTFKPIAQVPVVEDADGMAYDPFSKQIFNTGGDGMAITPINPATDKAAPDIALGASPEFLAPDGQGSRTRSCGSTRGRTRSSRAGSWAPACIPKAWRWTGRGGWCSRAVRAA